MNNNQKQLYSKLRQVFRVDMSIESTVYPPEQIFINPDFEFLLTVGGDLVDNEKEYKKLMNLLKEIGESEYYIVENTGATLPYRHIPFTAKIPVKSDVQYLHTVAADYNPHFGFMISNFYIFGKNPNWGIHLCECPTINIIGCSTELADRFRKIFNIKGNGYKKEKSFIKQEFLGRKDWIKEFQENYKL